MKIVSIQGKVLYDSEKESMKDALVDAVKSGANIRGANLVVANLRGADLRDADLICADLRGANIRGANLYGADLRGANLRGADLGDANLYGADLRGANLRGADLGGADLRGSDLGGTNLRGADLRGADLRDADLRGADLRGADLEGTNLRGTKDIQHIPLACPSEGAFTAWKKVDGKLVELEIPADARRSSATTEKCRCDKAKVISITDIGSNKQISVITNMKYTNTLYKVGEMVYPDAFDEDRFNECSTGIHFFIDKQSAINY